MFDNGDNPKTNYENARKELVGIIYVSDDEILIKGLNKKNIHVF